MGIPPLGLVPAATPPATPIGLPPPKFVPAILTPANLAFVVVPAFWSAR